MQTLLRQLDNFSNSPHATYRLFLSASIPEFYAPLLHVDLPAPLRLITYLRGLNLISNPQEFSCELQALTLAFQAENQRFLKLKDALCMRRFLRDVETQIELDVQRLFTSEPFFAHSETRRAVSAMARTFCCLRSFCIYKQGIHEIFAIAYLISYAGCGSPSSTASVVAGARSPQSPQEFGEATCSPGASSAVTSSGASLSAHMALLTPENAAAYAYFIGVALMRYLGPLYADTADIIDVARRFGSVAIDPRILTKIEQIPADMSLFTDQISLQESVEYPNQDLEFLARTQADQAEALEFLEVKKYAIQPLLGPAESAIFQRVRRVDPAVAERLDALKLENVFLLRWLRLAFLREVELPRVPRLWDFLIYGCATTQTAEFLVDFAAALLLNMRDEIIGQDYAALMRLFSSPALSQANGEQVCQLARGALKSDLVNNVEPERLPQLQHGQQTDALKLVSAFNSAAAAELVNSAKEQDFKRVREIAALLQAVRPENAREFQRGLQAQEENAFITSDDAFAIVCRDLVRAMNSGALNAEKNAPDDGREISE